MNPFTKGKKVRAIRDTESYGSGFPIKKGAVLEVSATSEAEQAELFNAWRPDVPFLHIALAKDDFEPADPTPAPLDPSKVKAGDTVTLDSDELAANVTGRVTDVQHDHGAWTIYLTLGVMGHSTPFVVGVGTSWRLVAHDQPAPEPEPEWQVGQFADITTGDSSWVRAIRVEVRDGEHVWQTLPSSSWWSDANVRDVRPLVVIDPAAVDVEAVALAIADEMGLLPHEVESMHREAAVGALRAVGIEATS